MPVHDDLIRAIEAIVADAESVGYADPGSTNDVYENYVWTLALQAASYHDATISYQTVDGATTTSLVFRTAPGAIYSSNSQYTHAVLSFPDCPPLEVHVGVRITGKSRVLHECDVAVIDGDEADLCRREQVHPRASKVLIAVECKFYTTAIQLHLGRGFLGLTNDILRKDRYFVTNGASTSVNKLITYHQTEWEFGVLPKTRAADALVHSFARAFRNYRARFQ